MFTIAITTYSPPNSVMHMMYLLDMCETYTLYLIYGKDLHVTKLAKRLSNPFLNSCHQIYLN